MSERFGFNGPPLLTFKTDRLDLRGLDLGKSDVKGSLAKESDSDSEPKYIIRLGLRLGLKLGSLSVWLI